MTRLVVDGAAYEVRAVGSGPAVLLLHGFTGRGADWGPFLPSLHAAGYRTVVVDLLGHGRSDAPADPDRYALERQAADLAATLWALGAGPAVVIGYSFGARVALRLVVDHPATVRALVLESPSAGMADPGERADRREADAALAARIERDGIEAFVDSWWDTSPVFTSERGLPASRRARLRADRLRNRAAGLAGSLRGAGQGTMTPLHDRLAAVDAPTLIVAGALDPTGVARAREIAGAMPHGRLEIIDGVGHAVHREAPARFRHLVLGSLQEVPAA